MMTGATENDVQQTNEHSMAIPEAWEMTRAPIQLNLVDTESQLDNLSASEREQLCHSLLGDLRRTYRLLTQQATRVRERVMADRLQGDEIGRAHV